MCKSVAVLQQILLMAPTCVEPMQGVYHFSPPCKLPRQETPGVGHKAEKSDTHVSSANITEWRNYPVPMALRDQRHTFLRSL
jgi:hypothetical protein